MPRSPSLIKVSRRSFVTGSAVVSAPLVSVPSAFEAWEAERRSLEEVLDGPLAAAPEEKRAGLLTRVFELEEKILRTPSADLRAIRAKARLLSWYLDMEDADGAVAMRHIRDFLESKV